MLLNRYCNFNEYTMLIAGMFIFLIGFINLIITLLNPASCLGCISYIFIGVYISFTFSNSIKKYSFEIIVPKSIKSVIFQRSLLESFEDKSPYIQMFSYILACIMFEKEDIKILKDSLPSSLSYCKEKNFKHKIPKFLHQFTSGLNNIVDPMSNNENSIESNESYFNEDYRFVKITNTNNKLIEVNKSNLRYSAAVKKVLFRYIVKQVVSYKDTMYNKLISSIYDKANSISTILKSYNTIHIPTNMLYTCNYLNNCCRNISNIAAIYTKLIYKTMEFLFDNINYPLYSLVYNSHRSRLQSILNYNYSQQIIQSNEIMIESNKKMDRNIIMLPYKKDENISSVKCLLLNITKYNIFSPIHHNSYYLLDSHLYSVGNDSMEHIMMYINTLRIAVYLTCLFTYKLNHSSINRHTWVMKIIFTKIYHNIQNNV